MSTPIAAKNRSATPEGLKAEDVVEEAFFKAYKKLDQFQENSQ